MTDTFAGAPRDSTSIVLSFISALRREDIAFSLGYSRRAVTVTVPTASTPYKIAVFDDGRIEFGPAGLRMTTRSRRRKAEPVDKALAAAYPGKVPGRARAGRGR